MGRQHVHVAVTAGLAVALATGGFPTAAVAETLGIKKDEASQTASESSAAVNQEGGVSSSSDETVVAGDERHGAKGQDSTIADGAFDSSQSVAPDDPDLGLVPDSGAPAGGDVIEPEQPQEDDYEILDNLYLSR